MPRAPKACPIPGCPRPIVERGRCTEHQFPKFERHDERVDTTHRRWREQVKPRILARDYSTCWRCGGYGTEVDHIIPRSQGGGDEDDNLAAICPSCHRNKSALEAVEARRLAVFRRREQTQGDRVVHPDTA